MVAPAGPMYQAGTLAGNPLAMSAGIATLDLISDEKVWDEMEVHGRQLDAGSNRRRKEPGFPSSRRGSERCGQPSLARPGQLIGIQSK